MKFDVVVIGGGLSGLVCGIRLQEAGLRCAVVSMGQSELHYSSGSFDLLSQLPDGTPVTDPVEALDQLEEDHPYRRIGKLRFEHYAEEIPPMLYRCNILVQDALLENRYRITSQGQMRPTWLPFADFRLFDNPHQMPWKKALILNFEGFTDFYVQPIAEAMLSRGVQCHTDIVVLPSLEKLRQRLTELASVNVASVFEYTDQIDELVKMINPMSKDYDVVVLPAVFGLTSSASYQYLCSRMDKELCLVPTMPPSVPGLRTQRQLRERFCRLGGTLLNGDTVERAIVENHEVKGIFTVNQGEVELTATHFVLATGSFFSHGLVTEDDEVKEPIFGVDVQQKAHTGFGVKTDAQFHPMMGGQRIKNLYAIGSVLPGFDPMREGCSGGVALLTAFAVSNRIINQTVES